MPFLLQQQNERSLFGKSFVFETYKYEWSIEDNESCNRKRSQIYLRNENEIPLFREFPFSGTTKKPFSQYLSGIHLLLSDIRRSINCALIWHPELKLVRSKFEYSLRRRADARYVGFFISWLWKFDHRSSTRSMPNFGVSLSNRRHAAVSFETNHLSL